MSPATPDEDRTVLRPHVQRAAVAADSGSALPGGTYLGEFEIVSVLGEGGFGIVYAAQDHSLQRRVAVKEYMPTSLAQRSAQPGKAGTVEVSDLRNRDTFEAGLRSFINEAQLLASFDHPALVKVYRFWEANGTAYMVMPLVQGTTMKDTIRRSGPPDEAWLMRVLGPLTEALAVIHAENCFHRDIAPDNILLLGNDEKPLLLDFGAARRVIGDRTQALTVILKPGYAPVEQYAELPDMKQGAWTDLYALAATVHWAIMGRTPPPSLGRLVADSYQPLVQTAAGRYSPGFLRAIDRALAVRPAQRTASIDAFRAELGLPPAGALDATRMGASEADLAALRALRPPSQPAPPTPPTHAAFAAQEAVDVDLDAKLDLDLDISAAPARPSTAPHTPTSKGSKLALIALVAAGLLAAALAALWLRR
jgi:serine/threonine protein kinase